MWKAINRTCGRAARSLGEYLDGTLPLRQRRALEAHLRACAACRRELQATRRTLALLTDLPRRTLSDDFDLALRARLADEAGLRSRQPGVGEALRSLLGIRGSRDRYLRAPWPSMARRLAPAGALAALLLSVVAWQAPPPAPGQPSAYVAALVWEHQRLASGSDLNSTVVSHNLSSDALGDGEDE